MRVALVHDWLTGMRGGEKVLSLLCEMFPTAHVYTLLHEAGSVDASIERMPIHTSCINDLPWARRHYRHLLGLLPAAIERMDVGDVDVVISSSHCVAKGIGCGRAKLHLCYCYSPMRYAWDLSADYADRMGLAGLALRAMGPYLRAWDRRSARRVDRFVAISRYIAGRIRRCYGRDSDIVYPPIDENFFTPNLTPNLTPDLTPDGSQREDFYLVVSAFAPYKRVDLAIEAFARLGRPLKVIGTGQMYRQLAASCPPNVELRGWRPDEEVRDHYRRCRALIFPGEEDFGLVPVEAMACGAPVIALAAGGATETVRDVAKPNPTGLLYEGHTVEALCQAVQRFEALNVRFNPATMYTWASGFGQATFRRNFMAVLQRQLGEG